MRRSDVVLSSKKRYQLFGVDCP
ncbi:hypothetical protein KIPB_012347, partial [Kipferlia bialata]|eukprot:g12347.t1